MRDRLRTFFRDEEGQDLIEYAFLGCAVALAAIAGAELLGTTLNNWYSIVGATAAAGSTKATNITF